MSVKEQVSADQWKLLVNAPGAASTYVATASGGGFEVFKEVFSASKFTAELGQKTGGSGYGSIVDEILAAMKGLSLKDAQAQSVKYESKDPAGMRAEMKKVVTDAAAAVAAMPDAEGFKRWIVDMARKVAETKTGGMLGFGGTSVIDEKEQAALDELAAMLGV